MQVRHDSCRILQRCNECHKLWAGWEHGEKSSEVNVFSVDVENGAGKGNRLLLSTADTRVAMSECGWRFKTFD